MRITGGLYGGRLLEAPKDRAIRPTSDKVRQAIFNILNARGMVDGAVALDAFCGTGALGIEALSWGALCCTFMDKNRSSLSLSERNFAALKIEAQHSFLLRDAARVSQCPSNFAAANLVFLDPPYNQNLIEICLPSLLEGGWITQDAAVLIESEKDWDQTVLGPLGYDILMSRDYGDTRITLAQKPA